ncbi:unnamed protein product [Candidula unifasciata]|uniref:Uncharacterized protein n=1 Tax=Candidula unifasciata TaxID=100452 RepID=A0A8S3Z056_9EUPU|nr:unnamed protein product [Candidula unifasciata]
MNYIPKSVDYRSDQDKKAKQLKKHLERAEKQMIEQALLRQKLEELVSERVTRKHRSFDKTQGDHLALNGMTNRIDRQGYNIGYRINNKVLEEIAAKTREFKKSQAQRAADIRYLTQERQHILEAYKQLQAKRDIFRSIPSPVGEATERIWGQKYSIYTPMHYDEYSNVFTPAFQDGYYTYFPRPKRKKKWFNSQLLFVPMPLYQSSW